LDHPNIIKLYDVVRKPNIVYPVFVMEYVDTGALNIDVLYKTFGDEDIQFYMYKILKALDYTHSRGIMHRDIAPCNIVINHEAREVKIIDWSHA
jgi:casein kinase II subunit alpha